MTVLCTVLSAIQYMQPRNYTCKIIGLILKLFYFYFYDHNITSLCSWVVRIADCKCESCRFKSLHKFSCDSKMVACTVVCCSFSYLLWLRGLSCLFLLQNYCMVVGSNPVDGSILYTQIRNHPTPLLYHVYWQLPPPWKEVLYNQRRLGFVAL